MDRAANPVDIEVEIDDVMQKEGVERAEAITIVALRYGEVYGDGDLVSIRPLTDQERRLSGLSNSWDEVMAAQRARQARQAANGTSDEPRGSNHSFAGDEGKSDRTPQIRR